MLHEGMHVIDLPILGKALSKGKLFFFVDFRSGFLQDLVHFYRFLWPPIVCYFQFFFSNYDLLNQASPGRGVFQPPAPFYFYLVTRMKSRNNIRPGLKLIPFRKVMHKQSVLFVCLILSVLIYLIREVFMECVEPHYLLILLTFDRCIQIVRSPSLHSVSITSAIYQI